MIYLASFLPVDEIGTYKVQQVHPFDIPRLVGTKPFTSKITWRNTATVLSGILGCGIMMPRETEDRVIRIESGDEVLIAKPKQGLTRDQSATSTDPNDFVYLWVRFE